MPYASARGNHACQAGTLGRHCYPADGLVARAFGAAPPATEALQRGTNAEPLQYSPTDGARARRAWWSVLLPRSTSAIRSPDESAIVQSIIAIE
jgi:hypothetical protein